MKKVFCSIDHMTVEITEKQVEYFETLKKQIDETVNDDVIEGGDISSVMFYKILFLLSSEEHQQHMSSLTSHELQQIGITSNYLECRHVLELVYKEMERRVKQATTFKEISEILNINDDDEVSMDYIEELKNEI
jgi:hypothetical protein